MKVVRIYIMKSIFGLKIVRHSCLISKEEGIPPVGG